MKSIFILFIFSICLNKVATSCTTLKVYLSSSQSINLLIKLVFKLFIFKLPNSGLK